jgi:hypothetical protein
MLNTRKTLLIMAALLLVGLVMVWLTKMMMGMELSAEGMATKTVSMETGTVIVVRPKSWTGMKVTYHV